MKTEVRRMYPQDAEAVMRISAKIAGRPTEAQWETRMIDALTRNPLGCLVAEEEGAVVGFIFGEVRGWDFAIPKTGWIDIVGVDPDCQRHGVARSLIGTLISYFRNQNVERVMTMVNWNDGGLVGFFRNLGFERSEFIVLERGAGKP